MRGQLNKRYDGIAIEWDKLTQEIAAQGIEVTKPDNEVLDEADKMTPEARRYLDKDGQPTGEMSNTAPFKNAGSYELIINSSQFAKDVLNHMRERLSDYQEMYDNELYNLEATPAESTAFRLAKHDRKRYPDIITAGGKNGDAPYYTNSSHLP